LFGFRIRPRHQYESLVNKANPNPAYLLKKYGIPGSSVLHIGAHFGEEIDNYIEGGIERGLFIEGDSDTFKILKQKVRKYPGFQCMNVLVSDRAEEVTFWRASNQGASSSILQPAEHLLRRPEISFQEGPKLSTVTLDSLNLTSFDLIVIDVQGVELRVIEGGQKTISNAKALWIEVSSGDVYMNDCNVNDIIKKLSPSFIPVFLNMKKELWGDIFFIRK
jgi:FkbM family methyltransferase